MMSSQMLLLSYKTYTISVKVSKFSPTSATVDSVKHEANWICPGCQQQNDRTKVLCRTKQCDYIHLIQHPTKCIQYAQL